MKRARINVRLIITLSILGLALGGYTFVDSWQGIKDKTLLILEAELKNKVVFVTTTAMGTERTGKDVLLNPNNWDIEFSEFASAEIYPFVGTGRLFQSRVYSNTQLKKSYVIEPGIRRSRAQNEYGVLVLRVSTSFSLRGEDYGVNADLSLGELARYHAPRAIAFGLFLLVVVAIVLASLSMPANIRRDADNVHSSETLMALRLRAAIEALEVDVVIATVVNGQSQIIFVTRGFLARMGMHRDAVLHKNLEIFLPPERREWHRSKVLQMFEVDNDMDRRNISVLSPTTGQTIGLSLVANRSEHIRGGYVMVASIRDPE